MEIVTGLLAAAKAIGRQSHHSGKQTEGSDGPARIHLRDRADGVSVSGRRKNYGQAQRNAKPLLHS